MTREEIQTLVERGKWIFPESNRLPVSRPNSLYGRARGRIPAITLIVAVVCFVIGYVWGHENGDNSRANKDLAVISQGTATEAKLKLELAKMKSSQHRYKFERDGASLWRYDEITGESCQVESNVRDRWIGGICPKGNEFSLLDGEN
jgi:hypothetical protein